jgi:hypothetical protein
MVEVEVKIPDDLLRQLDPAKIDKVLRASTYAVGQLVQGELQKSTPPAHRPVIWSNAKARRYYFAMRRKAGLPLRYTRQSDPMSQRVQRGWTVLHHNRTDAIVRNRGVRYARFVQAAQYQTAQHRATGWMTDVQAVKNVERSGDIGRITDMAARKELGL